MITICIACEKIIRRALLESGSAYMQKQFNSTYLTVQVLNHFVGRKLFVDLENHTMEQSMLDNHIVHLIRCICTKYIKIRLFYISKESINDSESMRHLYNKLILFKGQ